MWPLLREKLIEVLQAVAPLVVVVGVLLLALHDAPGPLLLRFFVGSIFVIAGMVLLFVGLDLGLISMGRFIGADLPKRGSMTLIMSVAAAMGFATTVAEPDVLVLAQQVDLASEGAISRHLVQHVIAVGVAIFVAIAMARVVFGFPLSRLLTAIYVVMLALAFLTPGGFVPLAFDAGSVTTGVLSAPVIIALALGLSSVLAGRSAVTDGFGLLGLASIGPIIAILILGILRG